MTGPTRQEAAQELLRRKYARQSMAEFAQAIDIPGKPAVEDEKELDWLFKPVESIMAAHHVLLCDTLDKVLDGEIKHLMVFMPPGSAKALALDTPIPTPSGWTTMGALAAGDEVFDETGKVCRVTWKSPIHKDRPVYRVRTDCGDEIIADADHEWRVCLDRKRPVYKIKETGALASQHRAKRPMIERAQALELPPADLPIDPYVLGQWLGNGHSAGMRITSHADDHAFVRSEIEKAGYQTTDQSAPLTYGIVGVRHLFVGLGLLNDPAHNTYGRKHIPAAYMRASPAQRLALLQGLVDSDGTVCRKRGCTTFSNTNLELAQQCRELVRALGFKAGWSESRAMLNGKDCGPSYKVGFYMYGSARLPRKAELTSDQWRTPNTYIDFERVENCDTVCIEVDSPSHLFLCGRSMTPTHNSTYASVVFPAYAMGKRPGLKIILASYASAIAWKQSRRTRSITKSAKYRPLFNSGIQADNQSVESWSLENGSEYMAGGLLAGMTGNRAGGIIIDDPVAGREDADSETLRKKTQDAYDDDLKTRLIPGGWTVIVQTRWHESDLSGSILPKNWDGQSGKMIGQDGQEWYVLCLPAICDREDDPLGRKIGEPLWPEWFSEAHFDKFRSNPRTWSALFQQRPRPSEGAEFRKAWLQKYVTPPRRMNKIILVDPAGGKQKDSGDYTCMWVLGLGEDQNAYVLDCVRDRLNLTERTDALFALHRKWKPLVTRYEEYGLQADIAHIRAEQERQQYRFKIVEVGGTTKKEDRIRRLVPWFESGKIYMPQVLPYTDTSGKQHDLMQDFEAEFAAFPVARHDDMMDALARLEEPKLKLSFPSASTPSATGGGFTPHDSAFGY